MGLAAPGSHFGDNMDILIHGFIPPSTNVAPRFPSFENTAEWDDFGEIINPDDYMMKQEEMDNTLMFGPRDGLDTMIFEDSACLLLDSTPSKIISNEMTVHVKCSLIYMDFDGCSDERSIKSVIAHVAPGKLVLVHGSTEATEHLKMHCVKNLNLHVYAPQIEETIDVTSCICAYKVQLSEKLMSNNMPKKVEFAGGALRCGEYITLRKMGDSSQKGSAGSQQIVIEGPLCEDYYKIRKLLDSQFYLL